MLLLFILVFIGVILEYNTFAFTFGAPSQVQVIALADLNGSGRLDAYLGIGPSGEPYNRPDRLLFNDGDGRFTESRQELHTLNTDALILADMNKDDWIDLIITGSGVRLYLNNGSGNFNRGSFSVDNSHLSNAADLHAVVGDINDDGTLDLIACCSGQVWLNDGAAYFPNIHQTLRLPQGTRVALADLNGDSFPDLFAAGTQTAIHTIWFNDGQGTFTAGDHTFGINPGTAVKLGSLNDDPHPDAVIATQESIEIWYNDGQGRFNSAPQPPLNATNTRFLFLADMNNDSLSDLITGSQTSGQIWLNDGQGSFSPAMTFSYQEDQAFAVGDVNNDGLFDIFLAGMKKYQIWRGLGDGRIIPDSPVDYG
jgi:hypothetical protein